MNDDDTHGEHISSESGVDDGESSLTESQKGERAQLASSACHHHHAAASYAISRPAYNKMQFMCRYEHDANRDSTTGEKLRELAPDFSFNRIIQVLLSFVPVLTWLTKYKIRRDLPSDIAGGLTVGVMNIPQGLAYALLASLPPIVGLYTSFIPVLLYCVFGTSKHIAIGTFAIICTMVGEAVEDTANKFSDELSSNISVNHTTDSPWGPEDDLKLRIAVSLTMLVGIIQAAMGLVNLGFITVYLSRPLVGGFTTGGAFIVFTSQVKYFFGIRPPRYGGVLGLPKVYIYIFKHISETNVAALITGLLCVLFLVAVSYINDKFKARLKYPIPSQLLVIIIGAGISYGAKLNSRYDLSIVGAIPKGLPSYRAPQQEYFVDLIVDAFLIAIVAATTNLSLVKLFAQKHEYKTDSNQDLIAYGVCNIIGSLFSCFVSSGSLSRSVVQDSIGKTQITSLISSFLILLVLLFLSPLFEPLPKPVLAAIVVVSLRRLLQQFGQLRDIWRISQVDAVIWFISWFTVVILGIVYGLIAGFAVTLFSIIYRSSKSTTKVLGHIENTELYKDPERCLATTGVPGVQVVKFEGPLIFVNAESFVDELLAIIRENRPDSLNRRCRQVVNCTNGNEHPAGNLVQGVVSDGDKQITLNMVRTLNPMSEVASFHNMGSDDFTEEVTVKGSDAEDPEASAVVDVPCGDIRSLVLDFSSVTMIDFVGIRCLRQAIDKSEEMGVTLYLAGCSYYLYRHISRDAFLAKYVDENAFLSIHDAVLYVTIQSKLKTLESEPRSDESTEEVVNTAADATAASNEDEQTDEPENDTVPNKAHLNND